METRRKWWYILLLLVVVVLVVVFVCVIFAEGEDIMTKSRLARVRWQLTLVEPEPEPEPVGSSEQLTPGWELVDDVRKLTSCLHEVELLLVSPELQGADYDDISQQEDKLKVCFARFDSTLLIWGSFL